MLVKLSHNLSVNSLVSRYTFYVKVIHTSKNAFFLEEDHIAYQEQCLPLPILDYLCQEKGLIVLLVDLYHFLVLKL